MDRDLLGHLPIIVRIAERGGFAAAAGDLGMSPSAVSHAVRTVEARLGQPLFLRTTRSVALTEAGRALVNVAGPALREISESVDRLRNAHGRPSGLLRINAPRIAGPLILARIIAAMTERHPEVTVEVISDESLSEIVAGGFDAGVRLGELIAEGMVAVRLTPPLQSVIAGSPAYLAKHGAPVSPEDLSAHNAIGYRMLTSGTMFRWELVSEGQDVSAAVTGSATVTDPLLARELAISGVGLVYTYRSLIADDLASGALTEVLADHSAQTPGLFLYFPRHAAMAPKLRAFIDTARAIGSGRPER